MIQPQSYATKVRKIARPSAHLPSTITNSIRRLVPASYVLKSHSTQSNHVAATKCSTHSTPHMSSTAFVSPGRSTMLSSTTTQALTAGKGARTVGIWHKQRKKAQMTQFVSYLPKQSTLRIVMSAQMALSLIKKHALASRPSAVGSIALLDALNNL